MLEEKAGLGSEERRNLARPEGFEPPTLRSEVSPNPERPETGRKRSLIFQALSPFGFGSVFSIPYNYGNKNGNIFGNRIDAPGTAFQHALDSHSRARPYGSERKRS